MAHTPQNDYHFTESTPEDQARYSQMAADSDRACRIRGWVIPSVGFISSLLICLLLRVWYAPLAAISPFACLGFGVCLSLFAIPFHLLGGSRDVIPVEWVKRLLYAVGILANTVGTALCMTAYYVHLGALPSASEAMAALLAAVVLYGLAALFIGILPHRFGTVTAAVSLLTVAAEVAAVVFWIRNEEKTLWSLGFFLLLQVLITVIALHVACSDDDSPWLRFSSFASFGVLMIAAAVVLLILVCAAGDCDCDCGDCGCGDCCDCGGGDKPKTRRRTRRRLGA